MQLSDASWIGCFLNQSPRNKLLKEVHHIRLSRYRTRHFYSMNTQWKIVHNQQQRQNNILHDIFPQALTSRIRRRYRNTARAMSKRRKWSVSISWYLYIGWLGDNSIYFCTHALVSFTYRWHSRSLEIVDPRIQWLQNTKLLKSAAKIFLPFCEVAWKRSLNVIAAGHKEWIAV